MCNPRQPTHVSCHEPVKPEYHYYLNCDQPLRSISANAAQASHEEAPGLPEGDAAHAKLQARGMESLSPRNVSSWSMAMFGMG